MKMGCLIEGVLKFWIIVPANERISNGVLVTWDIKGAKLKIKVGSVKPKFDT